MRILIILSLFTLLPMVSLGQIRRSIYVNGGIEFDGLNYNYKFQQNGTYLQRGFLFDDHSSTTSGNGFAFNLGLHKRFANLIAIEFGAQYTEMDLLVRDVDFQNRNQVATSSSWGGTIKGVKADNGNYDFVNWYYSNYIATYFFLIKGPISPYLGIGALYNISTAKSRTVPATFSFAQTNEVLTLTSSFSKYYVDGFVEAGCYFNFSEPYVDMSPGTHLFIGLKYYFAGNMMSGSYQNIKNGVQQYSDEVVASGDYLALSVRFGIETFKIKHKQIWHNRNLVNQQPTKHRQNREKSHRQHGPKKKSPKGGTRPKETKPTSLGW